MTIAVHIALPGSQSDPRPDFLYRCFTILAARYPDHHFIFIFDRAVDNNLFTAENITPVVSSPVIRNRLLQHYFYNFKIPRLLNKYNATVFVSMEVCSLRTRLSQCLLLKDLSFFDKHPVLPGAEAKYLRKYLPSFLGKASVIAIMNESIEAKLSKYHEQIQGKLRLIQPAVESFFDATYNDPAQTKNEVAAGNEYFLLLVTRYSAPNTITALKAFSIFKKWQKSSMRLVLWYRDETVAKSLGSLSTYKYREDVHVVQEANIGLQQLLQAAYAVVYLPAVQAMEDEALTCIGAAAPVITVDNAYNLHLYEEGAMYTAVSDKDLSGKMMLLYKDEQGRGELMERASQLCEQYNLENAATRLWQTILPDSTSTPTFAKM